MRDNDFRNIDNNSVLVEYQENVVQRRATQSTETIPAAVEELLTSGGAIQPAADVAEDNGRVGVDLMLSCHMQLTSVNVLKHANYSAF